MGLMHDIGYADVNVHKVPKWLHATSSGLMVTQFLNDWTDGIGVEILNSLGTGTIVQDFITAIWQHNWDDGFCFWTQNNPLYLKQCTFNVSGDPYNDTSSNTPFLNSNQTWYRNYSYGNAQSSPFIFTIRVADNLDAIRSRLTAVQDDSIMMRYFMRLYVDQPLRYSVSIQYEPLFKLFFC